MSNPKQVYRSWPELHNELPQVIQNELIVSALCCACFVEFHWIAPEGISFWIFSTWNKSFDTFVVKLCRGAHVDGSLDTPLLPLNLLDHAYITHGTSGRTAQVKVAKETMSPFAQTFCRGIVRSHRLALPGVILAGMIFVVQNELRRRDIISFSIYRKW